MVPAVVVSRVVSDTHRLFRSYGAVKALMALLTRPLLGTAPGWMIMAALLMIGFTFTAGVTWTSSWLSPGWKTRASTSTAHRWLDVAFQSSPMGADVYLVGTNEHLGRTPFRRKIEYRNNQSTFVTFRLPRYVEATQEVRADGMGSMSVELVPLPYPQTPAILPLPATNSVAPPVSEVQPVTKAHPTVRSTPSKRHGHHKAAVSHGKRKHASAMLPRKPAPDWGSVGPFK